MTVHYSDGSVTLHLGDCVEVMRTLPAGSVDSIVTDPPYGLGFMGAAWDALPPGPEWAAECLRVLKPGGHLLAFGGTRTWHRLAVAIEDAGFELRDSIAWLYGSGFPKSLDVSKAIDKAAGAEREVIGPYVRRGDKRAYAVNSSADVEFNNATTKGDVTTPDAARWSGWGTALKPAFEPVVVARKPLGGTVAQNVLTHGVGALNIDACRIEGKWTTWTRKDGTINPSAGFADDYVGGETRPTIVRNPEHPAGRWPANVALDEHMAAELDRQSGTLTSGKLLPHHADHGKAAGILGAMPGYPGRESYGDSGGASRFMYVAKAPTAERPTVDGVAHATVKPLDLMQWLVRLVTPYGGTVLEPFAGSGTTVEAALREGMSCIAIEREASYLPLIVARCRRPINLTFDFEGDTA